MKPKATSLEDLVAREDLLVTHAFHPCLHSRSVLSLHDLEKEHILRGLHPRDIATCSDCSGWTITPRVRVLPYGFTGS